jgi:hypothetical protein
MRGIWEALIAELKIYGLIDVAENLVGDNAYDSDKSERALALTGGVAK